MKAWSLATAATVTAVSASATGPIVPPAYLKPSIYHDWAHKHWVWNHNGNNYQDKTYELVQGYLDHNIPVGAVDIDSMWETQFNNFEPNTDRFPDFKGMVNWLHDQDIRIILWATSMVNVENPDYDMAVEKNYLVRNGQGIVRPIGWWHGEGGLLDYSNPEATSWWHSKMDQVLDLGIDGWKTDGTDPYIAEYILFTGAALGYQNVSLTYRDYANYYYRDFFYYTREKRGDVGLIMSRPVDCQLDRIASICTPYSPHDVVLSGWMGDDDNTFNGLLGCMKKVIYSAWDGYTNYGCDIGGYRQEEEPDKEVFIRWAQYGAFLPLMENGGGGEHLPWNYDEETTNIYRQFVNEHYRLIPYLMNNGMESYESSGTNTAVKPVAVKGADVPDYRLPPPKTYSYRLGEHLLIHPVTHSKDKDPSSTISVKDELGSVVQMTFPAEGEATDINTWLSWWTPHDLTAAVTVKGGEELTQATYVPITSFPVYVRKGSYLPLYRSSSDLSLLFTWFGPSASEEEKTAFNREPSSEGTGVESGISLSSDGMLSGWITAHSQTKPGYGWRVVGISEPENVTIKSNDVSSCSWSYDKDTVTLTASCADATEGLILEAFGVKPTL